MERVWIKNIQPWSTVEHFLLKSNARNSKISIIASLKHVCVHFTTCWNFYIIIFLWFYHIWSYDFFYFIKCIYVSFELQVRQYVQWLNILWTLPNAIVVGKIVCWNLTEVTLAVEDTNSILTDDVNQANPGKLSQYSQFLILL